MAYYETTLWRTVGGQSGFYELESPWDTPFEFMLTQVSGNIAGLVILGFDANDDLTAIAANYATSQVATPGWRGLVLRVAANTPATFANDPIPVEARRVYVRILTDSAGAIYVTGHFRRQAPEDGAYMRSDQTLAAALEMRPTREQKQEAVTTWASNLATDNDLASRQSFRPNSTPIRKNTAHRRNSPSILSKLAGK